MLWKLPWFLCLAGVCSGVQVFVRDEKRFAVLFQSMVLPCHYTSVSTQTPVVQWVYKSYCRDRTRDTFGLTDSLSSGGGVLGGVQGGGTGGVGRGSHESRAMADYLDCSDSSRTVRTVASISGSSVTLSEFYKNRDISIINKADLRIGEVQWGDSGVYICKVVIADDLEGQSEANVELLVLGFSGDPEDLLPDFDLKIMPEWVFVAAVAIGTVLFLLLLGVCWCQCCPHSCCCYVRCWCCPETCCCPRHLYEAGKGIKTGSSASQVAAYPPYFVSGVPTMVPIAPPSLVDKMSSVLPSDSSLLAAVPFHGVGLPYHASAPQDQNSLRVLQYVEKQLAHFNPSRSHSHQSCSLSELSSLHEGEAGFRQTYRNIQKKALPAIPDNEPEPDPQRCRGNRSPEPQHYCKSPPSPQRYPESPPLPQRSYSDDPPSSAQTGRSSHKQHAGREQDKRPERWNPQSEHLQRKAFRSFGPTGSLDELEREHAPLHRQRGTRLAHKRQEEEEEDVGDYEMELREYSRYPSHRIGPPHRYRDDDDDHRNPRRNGSGWEDHPRREKETSGGHISPLPSPPRRRGTWDGERLAPPPPRLSPPSSSGREGDYDKTFLCSVLESKARLRGPGPGRGGGATRGDQDSDSPSRGSSKKSSGESSRHRSHSPSSRRETAEVDSLPPYSERERGRTDRPSPRPPSSRTSKASAPLLSTSRDSAPLLSSRTEEPRDKTRKTQNTLLSRDSLIV